MICWILIPWDKHTVGKESIKASIQKSRGGFRGGGGGHPPLSSGIRPPADPKGPPFDTFSEIHFWPNDPKIFLKAPLAPIGTNFEGTNFEFLFFKPILKYFIFLALRKYYTDPILSKKFILAPRSPLEKFLVRLAKNGCRKTKINQNQWGGGVWKNLATGIEGRGGRPTPPPPPPPPRHVTSTGL